jgi:predicted nucleic acid-binding protein
VVASVTGARVYLDANVFISAYEARGARSDHAWWILDAIEDGEFGAVTSELTLAELLVGPIRDGDDILVNDYQAVLTSGEALAVVAVDRKTLIEAALLRTMRRSLRLPDAIHVATARLNGCRYLVSDDRRLPFAPGVQLVQLGPHAVNTMRGLDT